MDEASITGYITATFDGVKPVDAWGDVFFFYNPDQTQPDKVYFATLTTKDNEYDNVSQLDRPSVFRLNIGIGRATYRSMFGSVRPDSAEDAAASGHDYTVLDQILPHPLYGRLHWICVLNPSPQTFETQLRPLLAEAYDLAVGKYSKRAARG